MAEIKHTFTAGKMNKDVDERLVPNGEYRHAENIQVRTTDGSDSGVIQNLQGNIEVGASHYQTSYSTSNYENGGYTTCVGSVANEKSDKAYFFMASPKPDPWLDILDDSLWEEGQSREKIFIDSIIEQDVVSGQTAPIVVDVHDIFNTYNGFLNDLAVMAPYVKIGGSVDDAEWETFWGTDLWDVSKYRVGMRFYAMTDAGVHLVKESDGTDGVKIVKIINTDSRKEIHLATSQEYTLGTVTDSTNTACAVVHFEGEKILEFDLDKKITGINIIDNLLFWTDGITEPKKINIDRCKDGTTAFDKHTKLRVTNPADGSPDTYVDISQIEVLPDSYLKKEHITVIKKPPKKAPSLTLNENSRGTTIITTNINYNFVSDDFTPNTPVVGNTRIITLNGAPDYRINDIIIFTNTENADNTIVNKGIIIEQPYTENGNLIITLELTTVDNDLSNDNVVWRVDLEQVKPLFELKLGRFAYRYKYEDNEYSSFSPWSELAFKPGRFMYTPSKGYNMGMVNNVRQVIIKDFIPDDTVRPADVKAVDILFKTTSSPSVYVIKTITREIDSEWEDFTDDPTVNSNTGELTLTSEMIHKAVEQKQLLRSWDNVPRNAKAQEIVGNRLTYGNYTQGYPITKSVGLRQWLTQEDITSVGTPEKSIKSLRSYKFGMVFGDKYGRETPVFSSGYSYNESGEVTTGDVVAPKSSAHKANHFVVQQEWENQIPPDWIDYVKYYVKETSNEYYNLVMDRWYDAEDENIWLSFPSVDRSKVDEETYLVLKNQHGSQIPVPSKARYKIIAIEDKAPDYIKTDRRIMGRAIYIPNNVVYGEMGGVDQTIFYAQSNYATTDGAPSGLAGTSQIELGWEYWGLKGPQLDDFKGTMKLRIIAKAVTGQTGNATDGFSGGTLAAVTFKSPWKTVSKLIRKEIEIGGVGVQLWSSGAELKEPFTMAEVNAHAWFLNYDIPFSDFTALGGHHDGEDDNYNAREIRYFVEMRDDVVENKPEFDGRFFVKVEKDIGLANEVLQEGNQDWFPAGNFPIAMIAPFAQHPATSLTNPDPVYNPYGSGTLSTWEQQDADVGGIFSVMPQAHLNKKLHWGYASYNNPNNETSTGNGIRFTSNAYNSGKGYITNDVGHGNNNNGWNGSGTVGPYLGEFTDNDLTVRANQSYNWIYSIGDEFDPSEDLYGNPVTNFGLMKPAIWLWNSGAGTGYAYGLNNGNNWGQDGYPLYLWNGQYTTSDDPNMQQYIPADMPGDSVMHGVNQGSFGVDAHRTRTFWDKWVEYWENQGGVDYGTWSSPTPIFIDHARAYKTQLEFTNVFQNNDADYQNPHTGMMSPYNTDYIVGTTNDSWLTTAGQSPSWDNNLPNMTFVQCTFSMLKTSPTIDPWAGSTFKALMQQQGTYFRFEDDPNEKIYVTIGVEMLTKNISSAGVNVTNTIGESNPADDMVVNWQPSGDGDDDNQYRSSFVCRFRLIDDVTAAPAGLTDAQVQGFFDGTNPYGLNSAGGTGIDPTDWDPRGMLRMNGTNTMNIEILSKTPTEELGTEAVFTDSGCWETEPKKKETDLDIYYEASSAVPIRLNDDNMEMFAPSEEKNSVAAVVKMEPRQYTNGNDIIENINMLGAFVKRTVNNSVKVEDNGGAFKSGAISDKLTFEHANGLITRGIVDDHVTVDETSLTNPFTNQYPVFSTNLSNRFSNPCSIEVTEDLGSPNNYIVLSDGGGSITADELAANLAALSAAGSVYEVKVVSLNGSDTSGNLFSAMNSTAPGTFVTSVEGSNVFFNKAILLGVGGQSTAVALFREVTGWYSIKPNVWEEKVQLPWFNCYSFGNGVESNRIQDDFNAPTIDNGVKASTTFLDYGEENRSSGLIYSGLYNSNSGVNNLNEFNMSQKITKDLNPTYGSIQALKTRDSDIVVFTEDKVLKVLANKDALFNADGNPQLTASDKVLGTAVPFIGDYGISKNPESLAWDQYRLYFTDKQRGAVLRLSMDGLTPISDVGMKSWFRDNLRNANKLIGNFDSVNGEYNLRVIQNTDSIVSNEWESSGTDDVVSFNEASKGWVSFKTFNFDEGLSVSGKYMTTNANKIYEHYNDTFDNNGEINNRNTFYGTFSPSKIKVMFNDMPSIVKSFKTINYEGSQARIQQHTNVDYATGLTSKQDAAGNSITNLSDGEYYNLQSKDGWYVSSFKTDLEKSELKIDTFIEKENKWFNYIKGGQTTLSNIDIGNSTVQGLGIPTYMDLSNVGQAGYSLIVQDDPADNADWDGYNN